jgi:putative ABC transport system substrate-binding protein
MKYLLTFILSALMFSLTACQQKSDDRIKVGIVVPLEHRAMTEIVAGFSETLKQLYHRPVEIKVANAEGDANLQRAIISEMRDAHYSLIVPIGISATQMSVATIHDRPILSLAANFFENDRKKLHPCDIAMVHDEISVAQLIAFIHEVYPKIHEVMLVHSSADKIFPDVEQAIATGKQYNIHVKHIMVSSLPELTTASQSISSDTQAIFVLKDNMIVSGISTLAKLAHERHIPLITSDQGSVQDGAGFALGVHEKEIGITGGKLAASILNGTPACALPAAEMNKLTVFVNHSALLAEMQPTANIIDAAKKLNYTIEYTN